MSATMHEICRASAGSGKTHQLTGRYLRLLAEGVDPSTVMASTFTRKAAGEILGRVLGRLARAAQHDKDRGELSKSLQMKLTQADCLRMLRQLADTLHRLAIGTLDSFFHRVAHSFALELQLPLQPMLIDERSAAAEQLRLTAIEAMLGEHDLPTLMDLLRRLDHNAKRSVTETIDGIVRDFHAAYRAAPDKAAWSALTVPPAVDDDQLQQLIAQLVETAWDFPDKRWHKAWDRLCTSILDRDWEAVALDSLIGRLISGEGYYNKPFPPDFAAALAPIVQQAGHALHERLANRTKGYHDLLQRFDQQDAALRRRRNLMLFSDVTYKLAHDLPRLGDDVLLEIYYRLDGRVRHMLLDEFQDTSHDQWTILEPVAQELTSDMTAERSFYCVGDAKQAIYGWRGGCAELFTHIEKELAGGSIYVSTLARSYRSSQVILDAVNRVFSDLSHNPVLSEYPAVTQNWDRRYDEHKAARDMPGYVRFETTAADLADDEPGNNDSDDDTDAVDNHWLCVARRIAEIHNADPARSIGVLVQRNSQIPLLLHELAKVNVQASGEGGYDIADDPAVAVMLSALLLADHPGHSAATFHVLHSPLAAVLGLSDDKPATVRRAGLAIRRRLIDEGYPAVIADWTRRVARYCDESHLQRLEQLAQLAERFEPATTLRCGDFVRFVQSSRVDFASAARVRLMTVHGAKGLGFDAVVLADLDSQMHLRRELLVDRASATSPVRAVFANPRKELLHLMPQVEQAAHRAEAEELNEELCTLYVAMTRARQGLYVMVRSMRRGLRKQSHARILLHALANLSEPPIEQKVLFEQGDPQWMKRDRTASPPSAAAPQPAIQLKLPRSKAAARSLTRVSPSGLHHGGQVAAADLLRLEAHGGMEHGTQVHERFAKLSFVDDEGDDEVKAELADYIRHPAIHQALCRADTIELWRERPFAVRDGDRLLSGVFDRVTFQPGGRAVIIDYKTDTQPDAERYRPQLQAYRRALAKLRGLDESAITCLLLFVGCGEVVEV
ncbi:MAG: UvrD-helicase domain-containing protein [Phycisphaeraceae bacterium]|nr:UvrD-helicase domain-containing protein [Phycisphaeraceae bacterium]